MLATLFCFYYPIILQFIVVFQSVIYILSIFIIFFFLSFFYSFYSLIALPRWINGIQCIDSGLCKQTCSFIYCMSKYRWRIKWIIVGKSSIVGFYFHFNSILVFVCQWSASIVSKYSKKKWDSIKDSKL